MKSNKIRGIIFDYGGTLDTRGDHWSEVIWDGYQQCGIAVDKTSYRDAYVYGERALAVNPIVTPDFHFIDILREKLQLQLQFLCGCPLLPTGKDDDQRQTQLASHLQMTTDEISDTAMRIATCINDTTNALLHENRKVLECLRQAGLPMVLVSNFYGNIRTVLRDAHLDGFFKEIVESAVVGVRKPYGKDIVPAHQLGCHTIWIKGRQWEDKPADESICDDVITRLEDMLKFVSQNA